MSFLKEISEISSDNLRKTYDGLFGNFYQPKIDHDADYSNDSIKTFRRLILQNSSHFHENFSNLNIERNNSNVSILMDEIIRQFNTGNCEFYFYEDEVAWFYYTCSDLRVVSMIEICNENPLRFDYSVNIDSQNTDRYSMRLNVDFTTDLCKIIGIDTGCIIYIEDIQNIESEISKLRKINNLFESIKN
jgi:hypothetical protein